MEEDGQERQNLVDESSDFQTTVVGEQHEEVAPPKPKLQPIIAPDMFPPFVQTNKILL